MRVGVPPSPLVMVLLLIGSAAFAQQALNRAAPSNVPPQAKAKTEAKAEALEVDLASSRVYIKVQAGGKIGHSHGVMGRLSSGRITLGGTGELVFDMRSLAADSPFARRYVGLEGNISASDQRKARENMHGEAVLGVARFPESTFAIDATTPLDGQAAGAPGEYQISGKFTLHGVERPLRLTAMLTHTDTPGALRLRGSFALLQSRFGIRPYSTLAGLISVTDRLEIWADLVLRNPPEHPPRPAAESPR